MICISSRLDEIADIWIRRIIKAIRLQLNCFSSSREREGGRASLCVKRVGLQGQDTTSVCVRCVHVRGHVYSWSAPVRWRSSPHTPQTCDLNICCNCPKTAHQWICLLPLGPNNMV